MKIQSGLRLQQVTMISLLLMAASAGMANSLECPPSTEALTTKDSQIPLDELEIRLKPLVRCELAEEAKGWMTLLKSKVQEISGEELVAKHKKTEMKAVEVALDALEDAKDAIEEVPEATKGESESTAAGQEEAEMAVAEAHKQIKEVMGDQEEIEDAVDSSIAKKVLEKSETETGVDSKLGKQILQDEKSATKQLDKIDTKELQDQETLKKVTDAAVQLADSKSEIRKSLLEHVNQLYAERTALIDRANLVINAFEEKGAAEEPITEYRQYIKAVSGLKVDVSDVDATLAALKGWLMSKEGGLRWGKNIAIFVVTVLAFYFLSVVVGRAAERGFKASRHTSALLSDFLTKAISRGIIVLGVLIGLAALEVNIGPVLAVIGALGFVVAFALQSSLGNFASGILILLYRPFDVGDLVEVSGVLGKVSSMNLLSTHIKTPDNKSVIISNNAIWGNVITNATATNKRRVDMVFGIGYQDDIGKAQRIMEDILSSHELVLKDPEPVVRLHELADSSVNFVCRPWIRAENYWDVYWDVTRAVKERFDAEEISIPYPQRDVHLFTEQTAGTEILPDKNSS
ncbi:MAG: mechanosensitive ion channel [gamma proteobacterium endosymbiont of Lamellibrachia anaximandri]|nr:mechanosensitive ion channel [gamma proteobacterium endosymbiont of Lamellibrachia anaximandri]MBL3532761.1 mechanosensitive ion channel [gamma proteobacterium endosymbiont of Lamellibrachia anaximandri]